uniref:energy transducer TonB n=1 Tax=uncultured Altererythrobacter sp. TaxID=500840 RepID=UPI00260B928C|nr:energy transducer TonB [uncultured Altererythrobacter sp.]
MADDKNVHVVLEPSTYWSVDFGEEKCRLARAFGEGEDRHLLFIEQGGPKSSFGFMAIGPAFERFKRPDRIGIQFGEFEPMTDHMPMLGDTEGIGASLIYTNMVFERRTEAENAAEEAQPRKAPLPRLDVETADQIDSISVGYGKRMVVFNTGNLGEAVTVMNECALNFVEAWGLNREAHESMVQPPKWKNEQAVARRIQATYPTQALRRGESGIIRLRVTVEEDGSISDCILNKATIADSLDSPACREMRNAQFEPALDKNGEPMRSFYISQIIYRINR